MDDESDSVSAFFKLKDHQVKAVEEMFNGCILVGDVGSGKSATVAAYYAKSEAPRDVYVITTAKKRDSFDWLEEFVRVGVGTDRDATLHGVLVVDSWNNIGKYVDVENAFFVFDEQRLVGSGSWTKSFYKIARANRWVLLSATPGDTWMDYIPVFVANGFYKNKTEFIDRHVVWKRFVKYPAVDRYLEPGHLVRLRNKLLVDMPIERHTTRHLKWVDCEYDAEQLERVTKKRWNVYEQMPLRDVAEMFRVARRLVATDPSRIATVREILKKHPRVIVFYNFDYELEELRTLATSSKNPTDDATNLSAWSTAGFAGSSFPDSETSRQNDQIVTHSSARKTGGGSRSTAKSGQPSSDSTEDSSSRSMTSTGTDIPGERSLPSEQNRGSTGEQSSEPCGTTSIVVAEWNGHKHEPVPTSERWVYLVQYLAGSEGWNCTTTDTMVFYSLTYSYKNWHQAFGRIDRLNTPFTDLHYYALVSKSWIDQAVRKSLRGKKSFNESSFGRKMAW